jgi:tetratricopeptide (TPR) repeat protein
MMVLSSVGVSGSIESPEITVESDLAMEIPRPNLSSLQPAARQKLETLQNSLEAAVASGNLTALEVREGFGFLGQMFHAFELLDAAEICYQNAAQLAPQDVRWVYYLGLVANSKGDLAGAVDQYKRALELGGRQLAPLIRLGNALLELGRTEEAGQYFQAALDLEPDGAAAQFGLGRVAALAGNPVQAIGHFKRALALQPEASAVHYPLALAYRATGDQEAAVRHLALQGDRAVSFPDDLASTVTSIGKSTALEVVADLARMTDDFSEENFLGFVLSQFSHVPGSEEQLIRMLNRLEESSDSTELQRARVAFAVGGLLVRRDRDEEAIPYFEKAVAGAPNLRDGYVKLGNALARGEQFEEALEQYDRALVLRSDDPEVLMKRATALLNLERVPEARVTVERAIELEPERGSSWILLGEIQELQQEHEAAVVSFGKAIDAARDPQETMGFHLALGDSYRRQTQFENAAREYLKALAINEGYVPALDRLADLLGGLGYYEQAAEVYRKWTEHEPDTAAAWLSEATFLILAERFATARDRLEEGLEVLPDNLDIQDVLARHLAACPDRSVRDGKRAVALARDLYQEVPTEESIETLAMALAEDGQFEEAIAWQTQLIRDADDEVQGPGIDRWRANLTRYESGLSCCAKPPEQGRD